LVRAAGRGTLAAPTRRTVADAATDLIAGMADGSIRDRGGKPYKPSTCRSYRDALEDVIARSTTR
jgi:hypothetical protein